MLINKKLWVPGWEGAKWAKIRTRTNNLNWGAKLGAPNGLKFPRAREFSQFAHTQRLNLSPFGAPPSSATGAAAGPPRRSDRPGPAA